MFYDVTLLTGADVKTFRGESGKKPASGEKELAYQGCMSMNPNAHPCVCAFVSEDEESEKRETLHSIYST